MKARHRWYLVGVLVAVGLAVAVRLWPGSPAPGVVQDPLNADRIEAAPGDLRGFNVLIITTDTTRADRIGCYGNERIATPVIDGLAAAGVLCEAAVTPSPSTLPGHASLLTGLYPARHGVRANGTFRLEEEVTTLAERLRRRGYATAAVVSAAVLDGRYGLDQGFDLYDDDLTRGRKLSPHMFRERPAELANEPAVSWLRGHAHETFFLWVHYFDPHAAYLPPEPYRTEYRDNLYDGEIAYVDSQIGALLGELDRLAVRDRTLVVYASDHGEGLGEHGEQTHSLLIYDSTLRVPLIFNAPSGLPPGRVHREVSLVDVVPTTLDLLGEAVPDDLDGVSLCREAPREPRPIFIETIATMTLHGWAPLLGVRRNDYKYILAPTPELYDLRADPGELNNLHDGEPEIVAVLGDQLARFAGGDPFLVARGIVSNLALDEQTRRELAALGYVATVGPGSGPRDQIQRDPKEMVPHWEKLQRGLNLRGQGRMQEAVRVFEECVDAVPGDIFARHLLASCYHMRWEFDKVLELARRSAELEPNDEAIHLSMAAAHLGRGALDEARRAIERALAIEPQSAQAYLHLGRIALRRGDEAGALELYERAIAMDPGTTGPAAYNEIGFLHLRARRLDEARRAYNQALAIDGLNGMAHDGLANVLLEEGLLDEAQHQLALALRFDPNQPRALASMAALMIERNALPAAIRLCERALELSPRFPPAHDKLGLAYRRQGRLELAETHYEEAIRYAPFLDASRINLAQLYLKQGRTEESMRQFQQALQVNPYSRIALANLGARHFNDGRVDQAFQFYERALQVDPDYARVHRHIASIYALRDDPHRAAYHLRRSLELDPKQPGVEEVRYFLAQADQEAAARPPPDGAPLLTGEGPRPGAPTRFRRRPVPAEAVRRAAEAGAGPWNVLLVTLDTTRADHLGCYGHPQADTPAIDALSGEGVTYDRAYAPVPLTLPSHCSMLTGLWPPRHGVHVNGLAALPLEATTLAEVLGGNGYATAAVLGAAVLDRQFGLDQGFDHYEDTLSDGFVPGRFDYAQRNAEQVTDAALEWLRQDLDGPFFLWVHYFDPHAPYEPPGFDAGFAARTGYDAEISYADRQLGRLLEFVDQCGPTVVVLTADHGEGLWEHGEPTHGLLAYDSTLRVPLIVRFPTRRHAGIRIPQPVSLTDIMPSVLVWLSLEPMPDLDGRLLPELPRPPAPAEGARLLYFENRSPTELYGWSSLVGVIAGHDKLILAPEPELYDLGDDPHETVNLYTVTGARSGELLDRVEAMLTELSARSSLRGRRVELSAEAAAKLRALGYVAGGTGTHHEVLLPQPGRADPKAMVQLYVQIRVATTLMSERRWNDAAEVLTGVVTEDPTNRRAVLLLAELVREDQTAPRIADVLKQAAGHRFGPAADLFLRGQLGLALFAQHRYAEAAEALRAALEIDPDSVAAHWHLAKALERLGAAPDQVLAPLQRVAELVPDDWRYVVELARACERFGQPERAASAYEAALRRWPDEPTLLGDLAALYAAQGRQLDRALALIGRAIETKPGQANFHDTQGLLWLRLGRPREAIAALERAVREDSSLATAYYHLGLARQRLAEPDRARAAFRRAIELAGDGGPQWLEDARRRAEAADVEP